VRNDLEVHLVPSFGEYMLDQIGIEMVEAYVAEKVAERTAGDARVAKLESELAELVRTGRDTRATRRELGRAQRERGLGNVSINKTLTLLRQVLAAAVRYGYIDRSPVEHVRRLKVNRKVKPFLQLDQAAPLVEATDPAYRPPILTLLMAGLRIGERLRCAGATSTCSQSRRGSISAARGIPRASPTEPTAAASRDR
jgi:site-specific recombinase XerC